MERLVTAEIDLSILSKNYHAIRLLLKAKTQLMAVVKGNAYGHGDLQVAKCLEKKGVDYFGVACLYEALRLRSEGIMTPILLLGYTDPESVDEAVKNDISLTVIDEAVAHAAEIAGVKYNRRPNVHVKVDTGMHRLGIHPREVVSFLSTLASLKHIFVEGMFTHFASSDKADLFSTDQQLNIFKK